MGNIFLKSAPHSMHTLDVQIVFTTLGMAVLDELQFSSGNVVRDVIGGSGVYSKSACLSNQLKSMRSNCKY